MIVLKKALARRTFLGGMGATVALPLLDAMVPALTASAMTPATPVKRLGFVFMPMGCDITRWTPPGTDGKLGELSPILDSLGSLPEVFKNAEGRHVIIVQDIIDTWLTLSYPQEILWARSPRSLRTACLLSKPSRRKVEVPVEYVGFTIDDRFVVGYGLDFDEQYRQLPYIGVMDGAE